MPLAAKQDHILIFPFFSKGHTIPLLHLASSLASRNILVSLITTPANLPFFHHHISSSSSSPNINLLVLPFPHHPSLPLGLESTDSLPSFSLFPAFLSATALLHSPFLSLLLSLLRSPSPPLCLISDFFLYFTFPICSRFSLPRLVFHGMSTYSMSLVKSLWNNIPKAHTFPVPGAPPDLRLALSDLPETVLNSADALDPAVQFMNSVGETDVGSWGAIVNSSAEIEPPAYVRLLESFYRRAAGGRVWLVGPMNLLTRSEPVESDCVRWLDRHAAGSVIYVAFGTQAEVSDEQMDEVAHGLVRAGLRFLWAVRSETWAPPAGTEDSGRIERGWVPQAEILRHVAVGGFVSHCGWNSVLESVSAGVPLLAWPMMAEQHLNAKMAAEELGAGIRLVPAAANGFVSGVEVERGVRELMEGEKGRRVRRKAAELAEKAKAAVAKGGSSYDTLEELLEELRKVPTAAAAVDAEEQAEEEGTMARREWHDGLQIA